MQVNDRPWLSTDGALPIETETLVADIKATRRHFTEAARAAAAAARRAKRALPSQFGCPELFVVRAPVGTRAFRWEIRKFGGVVLLQSDKDYVSMAGARSEGEQALRGLAQPPR